ncbi:MAG TPA: hypothetical protein VMU35_04275 [Methylomirabilota bacterium]|nr:hypothetical protein [Methylomirabilota bacterium]
MKSKRNYEDRKSVRFEALITKNPDGTINSGDFPILTVGSKLRSSHDVTSPLQPVYKKEKKGIRIRSW